MAKRRNRLAPAGRASSPRFIRIFHALYDSPNWQRCSPVGIKAVLALSRQYNGYNNGRLIGALKLMRRFGFRSSCTLNLALREAEHYGLILRTRQGGLRIGANLYALTWECVDEGGDFVDLAATHRPPGDWKKERPAFKRPRASQKVNKHGAHSVKSTRGPLQKSSDLLH